MHVDEVFDILRPGDAIVVTGGGHTTAAFRDDTNVFAFDSLPASVTLVSSASALSAELLESHKKMQEFTATLIRPIDKRDSMRSTTKALTDRKRARSPPRA